MPQSLLTLSSALCPLPREQGRVFWFTGLPGSGKSSICDYVLQQLREKGHDPLLLRMDERRKIYFPDPQYTSQERQEAYELFAQEAVQAAEEGRLVLMDASAPRISMRRKVRSRVPFFAEIYIKCFLTTAMHRERNRPEGLVMADMYAKALDRRKTGRDYPGLGRVIGVDVDFEEDPQAEMVLENDHLTLEEAGERAARFVLENLPGENPKS